MSRITDLPTCSVLPDVPSPLGVTLVGGLRIEAIPALSSGIITELAQANSIMVQLGPALAGLNPVFVIIRAVQSIFKVIEAVPGIVTPDGLVEFTQALHDAAEAIQDLIKLNPATSVPVMIFGSAGVISAGLTAVKNTLTSVQASIEQADALIQEGIDAAIPSLEATGECAKELAEATAAHAIASLGPIDSLLGVVKTIADLAGLGSQVPSLGDLSGESIDAVIEVLDATILILDVLAAGG